MSAPEPPAGYVRVAALSLPDRLLMRADGDKAAWRLHPLLRDFCLDLPAVEDPEHKRSLRLSFFGVYRHARIWVVGLILQPGSV